MDLSDKIVDLAIATTGGPGLAVAGIIEALARVAATTGVSNVRQTLHIQLEMMLDEVLGPSQVARAIAAGG